mgnify:CR=1 FL=1
MNLLWALLKTAGVAALTLGGGALLVKSVSTKSSDLVTGAIHFQKGLGEFHKGFSSIFCSSAEPDAEELKKKQELTRITIE